MAQAEIIAPTVFNPNDRIHAAALTYAQACRKRTEAQHYIPADRVKAIREHKAAEVALVEAVVEAHGLAGKPTPLEGI